MISKLSYVVMSLFLGWHTLAIVVAPAPGSSATVQSLRVLLQPYLTLFGLDNKWDFYAPSVARGRQLRYVIEDAAGTSHTFVPAKDLNWFHPSYWWVGAWHDAIADYPETFGDYAVVLLCRKHASLHPISITLLSIQENDFSKTDHLSGKHPMDAEFVTETTLKSDKCPG